MGGAVLRQAWIGVLLCGLLAAEGAAAHTVMVDSLVSPAWVDRAAGLREPLRAGMALTDGDRVITGSGSRALLRMSEGSALRLGENAVLALSRLSDSGGGAQRVVTGFIDVPQGAFRFTSQVFGAHAARRDVTIRIAAISAGIRGTDVWGKAAADRDLVCLIEGRIYVQNGKRAFTMQDPLSYYIANRDGGTEAVEVTPDTQLREWAAKTDIPARAGQIRFGGKHRVTIRRSVSEAEANALYRRLVAEGFPASTRAFRDKRGVLRFTVFIGSLSEPKEADAVKARLQTAGFRLP